jgi:hypothetical protein
LDSSHLEIFPFVFVILTGGVTRDPGYVGAWDPVEPLPVLTISLGLFLNLLTSFASWRLGVIGWAINEALDVWWLESVSQPG